MATRGNKQQNGGSGFGRAVVAALIVGLGVFAGIHYSEEAQAFLEPPRTRHVVDLIPLEEVGKPAPGTRAEERGARGEERGARDESRASEPRQQWSGREIDRGPADGRKIALTFDAGSTAAPVPAILEALREAGVKSTFFITGRFAEQFPEALRQIAAAGHELANHTWSHRDLTALPDDEIADELGRTDDIVRSITGRTTKPHFRPPHGARNPHVLQVAAQEGYRTVYWSLDSRDSVDAGITAGAIHSRVMQRIDAGGIVLLHCGSQATADALPGLLSDLKAAGYRPTTVSKLLR